MLKSVHHLNFLVRDLEAAVAHWRTLFRFDVALRESLPDRGVITARFRIGETWIVLVQPTETNSVAGRHLREHGEGPFLVSFAVENLELAIARTNAAAGREICGAERRGLDGWRIADIDTELGGAVTVQITEDETR